MYIRGTERYYSRGGQQHARRAPFLILLRWKDGPRDHTNFRAIVRKVAMSQCGHFMMGTARIKSHSITLSGTYGDDGLPVDTDIREVWDAAIPVPKELYDKWAKGGGWNSAGSEALDMARWAIETFKV